MSNRSTSQSHRTRHGILPRPRFSPAESARRMAATLLLIGCSLAPAVRAQTGPEISVGAPTILTNAAQIAALKGELPPGAYQARFQAVVLFVSPPSRRLYVQDGKHAVQLNLSGPVDSYRVGNLVEATGTVLSATPTLRLTDAAATILGDVPLPEPKLVSIHRLVLGEDAFRYAKIRGVVRDMYATPTVLTLQLTDGGYPFNILIHTSNPELPRDWLDAEIEVMGQGFPFFNGDGRLSVVNFQTRDPANVRLLTPGIADPFDGRPLLTIAEATALPQSLKQRIRVSGTVTAHVEGRYFFIDDGTGAMLVDTTMDYLRPPAGAEHLVREIRGTLQPGERVEVIGARHNWFSLTPSLMQTEVRRLGTGEQPQPVEVTLEDLVEGRHSGRVVTLKARLVDERQWGSSNLRHHLALVLRVENDIFQARWDSVTPSKWGLQAGNYVQITGVNDAEGGRDRKRSTFQLLLRSPADVLPAPEPPFWTTKEFQRSSMAAGGVAMLAAAWILLQRIQVRRLERRVAARTAELQASETRTRSVVDTALDAVISMDGDGRITGWNNRAEAILGWPAAEVLGRSLSDTIIPPVHREGHERGMAAFLATGVGPVLNRRIEVTALRRDGQEFPAELSIATLKIDGAPHFSAFLRDITDRKLAEAERERALAHEKELSELKSRFVSMVSHEFRTPLGIILGSAEILEAYLDRLSPAERRSNLRDITQASRHMASLMEEVLLLSRAEAGKMNFRPEPLAADALCERMADEVNSATGGRCPIHFSAPSDLPPAEGDAALLRHIFTNLLSNAVKYSPEGSPVDFTLEIRQHLAIFTITDSGIGIPEADAPQIFQAFHRGRNVGDVPGTGLGMVIVKRCVELHRGKIAFDSREGAGTRFVVAVPLFPSGCGRETATTQLFQSLADTQNLTTIP